MFGFDGDGVMLIIEWVEIGARHREGVALTATETWNDALAKQIR